MFFIYGTDAPIYHYPIVTSVMIGVNVFVHLLVSQTGYDVTPWILGLRRRFASGSVGHAQLFAHGVAAPDRQHDLSVSVRVDRRGQDRLAADAGPVHGHRSFQGFTQQVIMLPSDPGDDAEALVELFDDPDHPLDEETKEELKKQWR